MPKENCHTLTGNEATDYKDRSSDPNSLCAPCPCKEFENHFQELKWDDEYDMFDIYRTCEH